MKATTRICIILSLILMTPLFLLIRHFLDLGDQYSALTYFRTSLVQFLSRPPPDAPHAIGVEADDKFIVMAKTETEDTDWVARDLPSWQRAIYIVNPSASSLTNTTLTTPMNKGHEAMAYLTFIIDNYASLPSTMAFIHPHLSGFLSAWHTDTALHSNVDALNSLQIPYVQANGYANLRCNHNPGCISAHRKNEFVTPEIWQEMFNGTSTDLEGKQDAPLYIAAACCAQFAVSRTRVLERPLRDYEHFRQWIFDTELTDRYSGRAFEYLWHVIFGMPAV